MRGCVNASVIGTRNLNNNRRKHGFAGKAGDAGPTFSRKKGMKSRPPFAALA